MVSWSTTQAGQAGLKGASLTVEPNTVPSPLLSPGPGCPHYRLGGEPLNIVSWKAANSVPFLLKVTLLWIGLVFQNSSAYTAKEDSFLFLLPSNINLPSYRRNIRHHPAQVSWWKYLPWNRPSKWNVISKGSCFSSLKTTELQWELQVKYSVSYVLHREMVQDSKLFYSSRWKHGNVGSLQSPQIPGVIHSASPRLLLVTVIGGDWDAVFLGYPNQRARVSCTF